MDVQTPPESRFRFLQHGPHWYLAQGPGLGGGWVRRRFHPGLRALLMDVSNVGDLSGVDDFVAHAPSAGRNVRVCSLPSRWITAVTSRPGKTSAAA